MVLLAWLADLFEAARQNGVKRIAYASRAGVLGDYPQDDPATFRHHELPTTPRVTP
jgi:nucleoside-diphosphate-sugar epimerase